MSGASLSAVRCGRWEVRTAAFGLSGLTGFLLFASFPPLEWSYLAYVALLPLAGALQLDPGAKLRLGYFCGLVYWIPSLWFLRPVTIPGLLCLAAYCALYLVPVAWAWGRLLAVRELPGVWGRMRLVVGGAAWWCGMEQLRGWLLTGFPWNPLGVSQWQNLGLIQLASLGGVTAVSFVVVLLNLGIAVSVRSVFATVGRRMPRRAHPELYLPVLVLVWAFTWGMGEIRKGRAVPVRTVRMAVVQPVAGMNEKWDPERVYANYRTLWQYSDLALSATRPDVLVWPETALPEMLGAPQAQKMLEDLLRRGVPMLLGALDSEVRVEADGTVSRQFWNTSVLMTPDGEVAGRYAKKHLVMFGEYIPFARWLPFLRAMTPFPEDVTPGTGSGVLTLPGPDLGLGILICFEDLMPRLARDLVDEGAAMFVNQTNDAWFDPYWGSRGHLANAVFRSIEQRRPTLRAANSGVSGWIDPLGAVREEMPVRQPGFSPFEVQVPLELSETFYHRRPWAFPLGCVVLSLWLLGGPPWGKPRFFHRRVT